MTFLSLKDTPLGALNESRGWFEIKTPALSSTVIRTIVYIDGDVTTKLIGGQHVDAESLRTHFATIDLQASTVRKKLARIVNTFSSLWLAVAAIVILVGHDLANLLVSLALLVPVVIVQVQRRLGLLLNVTPRAAAVVGAAAVVALAVGFGLDNVVGSALVALALNISLIVGLWYVGRKLKRLFTGFA